MTSRTRTVSRTVITRPAADIDPKIAGVFAVAGATLGVVIVAVVVTHLTGVPLDPAVLGYVIPALLAALVGYLRRSSHAELIEDGVAAAAEITDAIAPVLEHVTPQLAPAVREIHAGIDQIEAALATPTSTTSA